MTDDRHHPDPGDPGSAPPPELDDTQPADLRELIAAHEPDGDSDGDSGAGGAPADGGVGGTTAEGTTGNGEADAEPSALDDLFAEHRFEDYADEPLVPLAPLAEMIAARQGGAGSAASADPASSAAEPEGPRPEDDPVLLTYPVAASGPRADPAGGSALAGPSAPGHAPISRQQRILLVIAGSLVAVLALVAVFIVGMRVAQLNPTAAPTTPPPSATAEPGAGAAPTEPAEPGVHPWNGLAGGECLDPYDSPWAVEFTVVDCADDHAAQLVLRAPLEVEQDAAFPGADTLQNQTAALCAGPGVVDLEAAADITDAQIASAFPTTDAQWTSLRRDYFCFVSRSGAEPLTRSLAPALPDEVEETEPPAEG